MKGYFYDVNVWLKMVEEREKPTSSDGAKWWLDRIKVHAPLNFS